MSAKDDLKRSKKEEKKKAVEEAEEELSDSDEEEELAKEGDKSGLVEIAKKKDKFKTVFAILRGGSLFYYKDARVRLLIVIITKKALPIFQIFKNNAKISLRRNRRPATLVNLITTINRYSPSDTKISVGEQEIMPFKDLIPSQ